MMTTSNKQKEIPQTRKIALWLLTLALWLATAGLGFLAFVALQDIAATMMAYVLARNADVNVVAARGWITTIRNVSAMVGGLLWLGMVVGGMEYHFRYVGQRRSWRVFAWTLAIEVILIVTSALFF